MVIHVANTPVYPLRLVRVRFEVDFLALDDLDFVAFAFCRSAPDFDFVTFAFDGADLAFDFVDFAFCRADLGCLIGRGLHSNGCDGLHTILLS